MLKHLSIISLFLCLCLVKAGAQEYVISGTVNVPDGYVAGLCCTTDTSFAVDFGETVIKDGKFTLKGNIDHPLQGMLTTNNLALVEQNHWPMDSIHWTYSDVFVSSGNLTFTFTSSHSDKVGSAASVEKESVGILTGTEVQKDYNEWYSINGAGPAADSIGSPAWKFIDEHPHSVVSVWLANNLLKRGYNLTKEQVEHLSSTITSVPLDPMRMTEFQQRIEYARKTTVGGKLLDLELFDTKGKTCHLVDIVPKGNFVLIDFWASWCGICIASMPEIAQIVKDYEGKLSVIAVSIDKKEDAWRKAMNIHPEPWPQYMTTTQGYKDLFEKYQVGNGVPYYIILTPDGNVLNSPSTPDAVREIMQKYN